MKMAVVGCEASGKTVFMCALADYYGRAAAKSPLRIKLAPENAAANRFERYQFRQMRCLRQWPPATPPNRTIETKWSLRRKNKPLADIDMLEFGGETFRAAFRDKSEANASSHEASVNELTNYLADADFFVVLVSIKCLLTDPAQASETDYAHETEALWVTHGLLDFIRANRPHAGVVIGLTQADLYRHELTRVGGPRRLLAAKWPMVAEAAQGYAVVSVASVSKTDDNGNPAPGYRTNGIKPVMQAFAKHCFGDENALENGSDLKLKIPPYSVRRPFLVAALLAVLIALASLAWPSISSTTSRDARPAPHDAGVKTVTNTVEKIVVEAVTNEVRVIVDRPITNIIEKIVERTSTITNTIVQVVERPVTNVIERLVTNAVKRAAQSEPAADALTDYRIWTDTGGYTLTARWIDINTSRTGVTLLHQNGKLIKAVLRKFSDADRDYIRRETDRHAQAGEVLREGAWVHETTPSRN